MQWTKREGHDSYQEVEVYIYRYIYIDKYSSRNCGIVVEWFGAHTYFGNGRGAVEIGGIGKGGSKASFESGGLFQDDVG